MSSSDYTQWAAKIYDNAMNGNEQWGISIRNELSESLSMKYGDIGYGVRPSEIRKGFATKMLEHGLSVCKEKGLPKVILGCYKDNQLD